MSGEKLSLSAGGRVIEVNFHVGDEVKEGDVLLRLDTEKLDNDIARHQRKIEAAEEELTRLDRQLESSKRQFEAARTKAEAELAQVAGEVRVARERRETEIRSAEGELAVAEYEEAQVRRLVPRAAAPLDLVKSAAHVRELQEKLHRARLPVDEGKVEVQRGALQAVEKDHALKHQDVEIKHGLRRGELAAARLELANLELARKQTVIRAHVDGVVTVGDVKIGDLLEPGKPVVAIVQQKGLRVDIAVPSKDVADLQAGMPARIRLDAFDPQQYGALNGTVYFVSPDSEYVESERKMFYLVRIELEGDAVSCGEYRGKARIGMTGQVEIVTGRASLLSLLVKKVRQSISLN